MFQTLYNPSSSLWVDILDSDNKNTRMYFSSSQKAREYCEELVNSTRKTGTLVYEKDWLYDFHAFTYTIGERLKVQSQGVYRDNKIIYDAYIYSDFFLS